MLFLGLSDLNENAQSQNNRMGYYICLSKTLSFKPNHCNTSTTLEKLIFYIK